MSLPVRALDAVLDPWAGGARDERVVALELFLMTIGDAPRNVPGADRVGDRVYSALAPGTGVALSWLVADDYVLLLRLRDLTTGEEWGLT